MSSAGPMHAFGGLQTSGCISRGPEFQGASDIQSGRGRRRVASAWLCEPLPFTFALCLLVQPPPGQPDHLGPCELVSLLAPQQAAGVREGGLQRELRLEDGAWGLRGTAGLGPWSVGLAVQGGG